MLVGLPQLTQRDCSGNFGIEWAPINNSRNIWIKNDICPHRAYRLFNIQIEGPSIDLRHRPPLNVDSQRIPHLGTSADPFIWK